MGAARMVAPKLHGAGGPAKILEFSVAYAGKAQTRPRQSLSARAGVSNGERLTALAVGAVITPLVWAGHLLLVHLHVL